MTEYHRTFTNIHYTYIRNGKKYTKNRIIIFSLKMKKALVFSENIGYNILYEKSGYHFLIFIFL